MNPGFGMESSVFFFDLFSGNLEGNQPKLRGAEYEISGKRVVGDWDRKEKLKCEPGNVRKIDIKRFEKNRT